MPGSLQEYLSRELKNLEAAGLLQEGAVLHSPQGAEIQLGKKTVLGFASENYLGWANDDRLKKAALAAIEELGTGFSSGRLSSGTHLLHRKLETAIAKFLKTEDALIYPTGYQANLGVFECLFTEQDFLFCDFSLHPSSVDGVRFSAARHLIFKSHELNDLEDKLKRSPNARFRAIVIEAVSPQDGRIAPLAEILALAKKYDAITLLDDSQGLGALGRGGRGLSEEAACLGGVDLITGSFGGALGCAGGGFIAGRKDILSWLRQKSRTYLFSGSPSPGVLGAALKAIELLEGGVPELEQLRQNTGILRVGLVKQGFEVALSPHPMVSVVVGNALTAQKLVNRLFREGIHALGFCFPVVPRDSARVRLQVSAAHSRKDLEKVLQVMGEAGKSLKLL